MLDALLIAMVIIWGANYSVIKSALDTVPPLAFNAARLVLASLVFAATLWLRRSAGSHLLRSGRLWRLALVGNTAYQLLFIVALSRTTAANSALIIGCTPVFVAILSAALGHEHVPPRRWAGVLVSAAGIYLVVGRGAGVTHETLTGDLLMIVAVFCWSAAAIIARPLLAREEPIAVTAWSMILGTVLYLPFAIRPVHSVRWSTVPPAVWAAIAVSGLLALCVSYVIWYTAVQQVGSTRTAVYSNMVPIAGLAAAWIGLGEPLGVPKLVGAGAVVAGVALTRIGGRPAST